jgi:hypothetical protein
MSEGSTTGKENSTSEENHEENLDPAKLKASNARLLAESKKYKEEARRLAAEKEERENKLLEESGNKDALLEAERKKAKKALDDLAKKNKQIISSVVKEKIAKYAGDVYNVEDLVKRPSLKEFLKEGLDEEKLDFSDDVAKKYVEEVKKEAPYLWKTQGGLGINTHRSGSTGTTVTVDVEKMSAAELKAHIAKTFAD